MARKKRMKKKARGRDRREGGERRKMERWEPGGGKRERCGEGGRGKGVAKGKEGEKKWQGGMGDRGRGEARRGGKGLAWEGVKKIENAMPRRHVYQGTQESMAER